MQVCGSSLLWSAFSAHCFDMFEYILLLESKYYNWPQFKPNIIWPATAKCVRWHFLSGATTEHIRDNSEKTQVVDARWHGWMICRRLCQFMPDLEERRAQDDNKMTTCHRLCVLAAESQ